MYFGVFRPLPFLVPGSGKALSPLVEEIVSVSFQQVRLLTALKGCCKTSGDASNLLDPWPLGLWPGYSTETNFATWLDNLVPRRGYN